MNWDHINLSLIGFFGAVGLGLTLLLQTLKQLPEIIVAIRKTVDAVRRRGSGEPESGDLPGPEPDEPTEPGQHE
ncbi:hypothetical protein [Streptomyces sp. NPDC001816]|uniref:hypothetical protein n=1 Tax=Streptomyces sp. NPDC001816 TaxID=3364612 RepID=UPI0036CCC192